MSVVWEPELDSAEQKWLAVARDLSRSAFEPLAEELDREQRYPQENVDKLVESGLAGLFISERFGGVGASFHTTCAVIEEVSRACASTSNRRASSASWSSSRRGGAFSCPCCASPRSNPRP